MARTIEGWFWFPPSKEQAFGTVEIRPHDLRLTLRDSPRSRDDVNEMTVIHGESLDGKELTVLGAFVTNRRTSSRWITMSSAFASICS